MTAEIHTCSYECERPGCIRAQRDELAARMTAETSNARGEWVVQRLRGVLEHGKMGDKCLIAPDLVTAAIAALSAQQSPAEAQPVAKLVNRKDADGGKTTTFIRPTSLGMDLPLGEYPLHLHPPPSAPVGVEAIAAEIRASLGRGATVCTRRRWAIELEALAQRPAAPQQPAGRVHDLAARLVDELDGLVGESDGVSGLHLNGDVATWDELLPGGRFERLSSLDELRAALAAQPGGAE